MSGQIGSIWVVLGVKDEFSKSISKLQDNMKSAKPQFEALGKAVAVGMAAVAGAVALAVKQTADFGDKLNDLRQRTGISTEALSSFKLAAEKSGTSLEGIAVGMRGLSRVMGDAVEGQKEAASAFASIGVSVTDASGKLRSMEDVMLDVADRFSRMEDGAAKTDLAVRIFGRSGMELIPMLNLGREGLKQLREEAHKLGVVMSDEAARNADAFNDSMTSLKAVFTGMRNDIANALIPTFTNLASGVTEAVALIRGKVAEFAASGQLQEWAISAAKAFIGAFKLMAQAVEGLVLLLPTLKAAVFSVAEAFYKTLGKIAEGISMIPGVSAQASVALQVWAEDLKKFADVYGAAADQNIDKASNIVAAFDVLFDALKKVKTGLAGVGGALKTTTKVMETAIPAAKNLAGTMQTLSTVIGETPLPGGKDLPAAQKTWLGWGEAVENVAHDVGMTFKDLCRGLSYQFENLFTGLIQGTQDFASAFSGIIRTLLDYLVSFSQKTASALSSIAPAVSSSGQAATGAAAVAGSSLGAIFSSAFLAVWAYGFAEAIKGVFEWNKKKSPEQFQAELAWIDQLKAQWVAQGLSDEQIKNKLANLNWWMTSPGDRGGAGATGNRWASGFNGIITQPTTATFGESGAERVTVQPIGAGATMPGGAGGITVVMNGPMISTTWPPSKVQADAASDVLFQAIQSAARRRGISLAS